MVSGDTPISSASSPGFNFPPFAASIICEPISSSQLPKSCRVSGVAKQAVCEFFVMHSSSLADTSSSDFTSSVAFCCLRFFMSSSISIAPLSARVNLVLFALHNYNTKKGFLYYNNKSANFGKRVVCVLRLECDRIGIISDTHGDAKAWDKAMELFAGCGAIFHAGDVLQHAYDGAFVPNDLADRLNMYSGELFVAMGNCDRFSDQELLLPVLQPFVSVAWNGRVIAMAHGNNPALLRRDAAEIGANLIISGHTHVAKILRVGSVLHVNPGSASRPMGQDPASIAIADNEGVTVLTLEGKRLFDEAWV